MSERVADLFKVVKEVQVNMIRKADQPGSVLGQWLQTM
jgi:hypothetical protein